MQTFNDGEFNAAIERYGFCPFKSRELSIVPCSPKCAVYIEEGDQCDIPDWDGCAFKSIAMDINVIRKRSDDDD